MIFKTFNGDLTVFNRTLISTKDHLKELQTVNAAIHNKNGVFNLQGLLVNSSQSASTFSKLNNAVKSYNGNLSKSTQLQNTYVQAVGKQNLALGNYLAGLNGAKASIGGYIKYLVAAKAASIGLQAASIALNTAISMGITLAISALVSQISKWIHAQENARQKAIELTNTYKEQKDSLDSQIKKYQELKESLDKGNLSTDETRSIKQQLLEIQQSLIESYGYEASNIDLVNGKYREQLGLLGELSKEKATDYVTENRDVFSDAKKELEKVRKYNLGTITRWSSYVPKTKEQQALLDFIESYSELFNITKVGSVSYGVEQFDVRNLSIKADVKSADKLLHQFAEDLERFGEDNNIDVSNILNNISEQIRKTQTDELKEYKTIYDEFLKAEVIRNDTLRPLYQQSIQAVEEYNNALSSGEGVEKAKKNLESVQQSVQNAANEVEGSQEVFDGIYDGINKSTESAYQLEQAFKNDESVKRFAEQLKGLTDIDLKAINFNDIVRSPGEEAFGALIDILQLSEDEVQNLIDKLVELGYVQGEIQESSSNDTKITNLTEFIGKLDEDAIKDYNDKILSLKSYLDKIKSGDFSNADNSSLADDFGITGDSVEELTEKIQALMDAEMDSIIKQIDEILNNETLDDKTKKAVENLKQSLIGTNKEAQNLNNSLSFKLTNNPLADVQSLSQGLDQLDKIYADILDKEAFDFSSILNNDQFKEQFSAYTDEYENFINTVSKSPDDINACQDAFNKLTAAYIKGSGVLSEVTEGTKAATIAMLKQMGVSNAAAIVEQALIENEKMLEAQKYATSQGCKDLEKATYEEINALIAEGETTEEVIKYLAKLAIEKWELNEKKLDTQADCENLLKLADYAGATTEQIRDLKNAMANLSTFDYTNPMGSAFRMTFNSAFSALADKLPESFKKTKLFQNFAENSGLNAEESIVDTMKEIRKNLDTKLGISDFKVNYSGGITTKDTLEKLQKEAEKQDKKNEETKEQFDWMDIKLNNLINTASKLKDKISDLLSFGSKKKQTQKAIEATTKALEAEYKAMKKYAEVAKTLSADAAKETTETVTESISGAVSDAVNGAVSDVSSSVASDVVAEAMKYVGVLDYVWGGTSLTKGADCSGFVQQVYRKLGMEIPRNTTGQYGDSNSISVSKADLQPGDLVFFQGSLGSPGNPRHVGIYAGNGQFIDSPTTGKKVQITSLSGRSDYIGAKRYAGASSAPVNSSVSYDTPSTTTKTYTKVVPGVDAKTLAHYQKLVREGSFDIETITNEKLKNAIKSYQEWYDKMKSCRDKIEELNNTLKELYQTMAEIPIEKRDKNVDTLDTRLDIINSKRDNINAVIVDPKKYASTKKTLKQSKNSVKKGIKTKAQRNATGLSKTEIDTIKSQMKKGQTIPAKILDKITNGAFYEQCKQYNDAVYEHSQYAKSIRTAGDSIKKYNTISDQILDAEKAKTKQYKTAYNTTSKNYGKSLDNVKSKGAQTKKAFGSKKFGLTSADINRINSCIKSGKQIPTDLMVQLQSQSIFDSCVEYNKAVMENELLREKLDETRFDLQKQQQAETAAHLQNKTEKHQNITDKATAKMERNEALAENADTPKKKNKYLSKNLGLLQTEYKHLIKIAELENDSVKAAKLRAELEKETAGIIEQQFQNISDYYSARRDKVSDKESLQDVRYENAQVDVQKKNDILNIKTRFAAERNAESEQEYTDTAKLFNTNRTNAKKAVNKVKKLSSSDKGKILKLMESKEEIPENLMDKVAKLDPDAYQKLLSYNDSLDWLEKAALNKKISNEELIKAKRENEIQKHQNVADRAQDKMDKNDALSEVSTSASEQNKYEKENIKYLNTQYKHLLEIAKLHEDDVEYARLEAEQQAKIAEAYKAMFDNVQTEFENKISLISNDISDLDNEIKKVEASGRLVDASYYNHKISFENESLAKLKEEEASLAEQLKNVKMFSPAWYECQDAIQGVQNAQADSLSKVKEYKDAINEIADTIQNDIVDAFHDVTDEAE